MWFSIDQFGDFELHESEGDARARAEYALAETSEDASEEWPEQSEMESICYGKVIASVVQTECLTVEELEAEGRHDDAEWLRSSGLDYLISYKMKEVG